MMRNVVWSLALAVAVALAGAAGGCSDAPDEIAPTPAGAGRLRATVLEAKVERAEAPAARAAQPPLGVTLAAATTTMLAECGASVA